MYECHVTIKKPDQAIVMDALAEQFGWKTSYINGDALLGKDGYFYFTTHHVAYEALFAKMETLAGVLQVLGRPVLRKKIEQIVYDTKTSLCADQTTLDLKSEETARALKAEAASALQKEYDTCEGHCGMCAGTP
jgi:hypothetical protein